MLDDMCRNLGYDLSINNQGTEMKKQGTDYILTEEEIQSISNFIDSALDSAWDKHSNHYICKDEWEDGKRRMDPEMYKIMETIICLKCE